MSNNDGNRKHLRLNTVAVKLGCNCRRPKLSFTFRSKPKPKLRVQSSSNNKPLSPDAKAVRGFGRIDGEGMAVEKDSDDPYLDFRESMLQMILEKEIYAKEDLRELLNCFLQLNSPYYHGMIVRAFTEIWNGLYAVKSSPKKRRSRE